MFCFLNWVCWTRGNFLASRVTYAFSVRHRCVECRAGTNIFGHFAGLGAGPVRVFLGNPLIRLAGLYGLLCLLGVVLAWMCLIKQVEGGGGGA
jgi:hypothetical protein